MGPIDDKIPNKQESVESNWSTTRARDLNNNNMNYADRSSDNRQQNRK